MTPKISEIELKQKIHYFLSNSARGKGQVSSFIRQLCQLGEVAIIGGLIRDLALNRHHRHKSDIDLVTECSDQTLENFLNKSNLPFTKNKFGGYRVALVDWDLDIWSLDKTWAFSQDLVQDISFKGLLKTTFFNWDAIIYLVNHDQLIYDQHYFDDINRRILSINLPHNPNTEGTLRRIAKFHKDIEGIVLRKELEDFVTETTATLSKNKQSASITNLYNWILKYRQENSLFPSSIETKTQSLF